MTGIVLSTNLIMMFFFWEGVGLSSYLLIGFWYTRESAAAAANKAFICNRLADFGFMIGILTLWTMMGTVSVKPADLARCSFQTAQTETDIHSTLAALNPMHVHHAAPLRPPETIAHIGGLMGAIPPCLP